MVFFPPKKSIKKDEQEVGADATFLSTSQFYISVDT